jgi:hypothetical protein
MMHPFSLTYRRSAIKDHPEWVEPFSFGILSPIHFIILKSSGLLLHEMLTGKELLSLPTPSQFKSLSRFSSDVVDVCVMISLFDWSVVCHSKDVCLFV